MSYINVYVDGTTIGREMASDVELTADVLREMDDRLLDPSVRARFVEQLTGVIFDEEDSGILSLLSEIIESFSHVKEEN